MRHSVICALLIFGISVEGVGQSDGRSTYHVFPQDAFGTLPDGSFFQSTLLVHNTSDSATSCTLRNGKHSEPVWSVVLNGRGWNLYPHISINRPLVSDYVSLSCTTEVFATLLYSYNSPDGKTIAEATVFSSPVATGFHLVADQRGSKRLGLAIANDLDMEQTATIRVYDASATLQQTASRRIPARSSVTGFLNEMTGWSADVLAQLTISCDSGCAVIGLRFAGSVFTTIPAMVYTSSTCSDIPRLPSSGIKPVNQAQTEKLCGNWRFTYSGIGTSTISYSLTRVFENLSSRSREYLVSGLDGYRGLASGGYDPINQRFWVGLVSTAPKLTFDFTSDDTVSGCYYVSSTCYPMIGSRTR